VSTYEDDGLFRPGRAAGRSGSAGATYDSAGGDPEVTGYEPDGDYGYTTADDSTSLLEPGSTTSDYMASLGDEPPRKPAPRLHGGADFGLLVLRLVVGGTFVAHSLQHLFGLFHGVGLDKFAAFVRTSGYIDPNILAWVAGGAELAGGVLFALGLFTPLAAAALLGLLANLVVLKWPLGFFEPGFELEFALGAGAFAVVFAGPGRVAVDRPMPWFRRPVLTGWLFLVLGAGVAVVFLFVLRNH
jgi:putative oxidoreductase